MFFVFKDDSRKSKAVQRLSVHNGVLGFVNDMGFDPRTNFVVEVKADIYSTSQYGLKGTT